MKQLLLQSKFLHKFFKNYYRSSNFFILLIINYKYNNLLKITLIFIITLRLL